MESQHDIISPSNAATGKLFDFLSALAARDRHVVLPEAAATTITIVGSNKHPSRTFPVDAFLIARDRGWIGTDGRTNLVRITRAGRELLRRHRANLVAANAAAGATSGAKPRMSAPAVNLKESLLTWLASRRDASGNPLLASWEVDAGERLRADLSFAQLTPRVTMGWSGMPIGGKRKAAAPNRHDLTDNIVAARVRVTAALRAVGPEFMDILIDVCGHLRGLDEIARCEGWPRRSARLLLQRALSALARHYGMAPETRVEERIAWRLRHWGADDYKPSLDSWRLKGDQSD